MSRPRTCVSVLIDVVVCNIITAHPHHLTTPLLGDDLERSMIPRWILIQSYFIQISYIWFVCDCINVVVCASIAEYRVSGIERGYNEMFRFVTKRRRKDEIDSRCKQANWRWVEYLSLCVHIAHPVIKRLLVRDNRPPIDIAKRSTSNQKVAFSRSDHWWQIVWPLTMAWNQWHCVSVQLNIGCRLQTKELCRFRVCKNPYPRNAYTLADKYLP